jgi:RNA polymerase sigma-B factor
MLPLSWQRWNGAYMLRFENTEEMVAIYVSKRSPDLRDAIVAQHAPMVERIARRFANASEPVDDLTQEGFIGLLNALEVYDPTKGVKFTTYATYLVAGQIKHFLRDKGKIIKEPAWLQELNQKINRVSQTLYQDLERQPSTAEIASALEMNESNVIEVLTSREVFRVASLDAGNSDDDSEQTFDTEKLETESTSFQLPTEDKLVLDNAIQQLKEIEQKAIRLFFYESLNQTEIAFKLSISCNYVSHILRHSVQKLRRVLATEDLKDKQLQQRIQGPAHNDTEVVDEQTGVYSAAYLRMRLQEELQRAGRNNSNCSLILIRLKGLERLRAFYGEMTVSEFLSQAAGVIKKGIRRADVLARGGDCEFGIILPNLGVSTGAIENRMRSLLDDWCKSLFGMASMPVSVTVVSVVFSPEVNTAKKMIKEARKHLDIDEDEAQAA